MQHLQSVAFTSREIIRCQCRSRGTGCEGEQQKIQNRGSTPRLSKKCVSESIYSPSPSPNEFPVGSPKIQQPVSKFMRHDPKRPQRHAPYPDHEDSHSDRRRNRGGEYWPHWLFAESTTRPTSTLTSFVGRSDAPSCDNITRIDHLLHVIHKLPSHYIISCCAW